ncbi:MAG: hypothetical protein AB2L07_18950 [Thermoanaerobaculaceae bacterium]
MPPGLDLERDWPELPTTARTDVATRVWEAVPDDADLEPLIVYRTAGTTGHPLLVPHHARAVASYQVLLEHALGRHGVRLAPGEDDVACMLLGAQSRTVTYATTLPAWERRRLRQAQPAPGRVAPARGAAAGTCRRWHRRS